MSHNLIQSTKVTRPFCVPRLQDYDDAVKESDKKNLMAQSRSAYSNNPLVRSVIQGRAMFTTKNAWKYIPLSKDVEWRNAAKDYIEKWSKVACTSGADFHTWIYQACLTIDREGDSFTLLVETKNGFPQLQPIPSHRVATRNNEQVIKSGKYAGYKVVSGVIVNQFNRPIAYNILADDPKNDRIVEAKDMIHILDQEYMESVRGIPLISHCLESLNDLEESKKAELISQKLYSKVSLIETLDGVDDTAAFLDGSGCNASEIPLWEEYRNGSIQVYRSQGSDLRALETNRPSPSWQQFREKIIQEIVVSLNWSVSLLDGSDKTSVENRLNIRVAEMTVADRIALLTPYVQRIIVWVLSKAVKNEQLSANDEFYKMKFSKPPFITADVGRIEQSTRDNIAAGIVNLSDVLDSHGKEYESHMRQRLEEQALAIKLKQEVEAKYGVTLPEQTTL